eukprot:TRINITY_DN2992_c0_g3_i4.p1 TRINITY_DN2992_c0_g3~~TRINITY_DN2992_c0_g3_i4.p1  ORF type:complete len:717 (-),score=208.90 TRINITY_DN2992_c0_g3_i4:384-2534(-)
MAPAAKKARIETPPDALRFLTPESARAIKEQFGTPTYVYDEKLLRDAAAKATNFPNAYGLTARFAMKAAPNKAILQLFDACGMHIDASSGYEVQRAVAAGVAPHKISLSTQELPDDYAAIIDSGAYINACSLNQLTRIGEARPGCKIGLRFNPGAGSGGNNKTNVGGPSSSFGIWHELADEVQAIVKKYNLNVVKIHSHIGSGSDPDVWVKVSTMTLNICKKFPTATIMNLGGGYKVARMTTEKSTDMQVVGAPVKEVFEKFFKETGRKLHLEIEPGTFMVANACAVVSTVQDMTETTKNCAEGMTFIKTDSGMTEVLRPSLYGAQHPIVIIPQDATKGKLPPAEYVVVGHCCESGDLLTPAPGEPETIAARNFCPASIGDICVIESSGAYCSSMSSTNYNSFPQAPEVLLRVDGSLTCIRRKQVVEEMWKNEIALKVPFEKYHGLGNDFVLVDNRCSDTPLVTPAQAAKICNRHTGVGADGVIFALPGKNGCDWTMRIFNSDSSEPEMCGNGIRCMAQFVAKLEGSQGQAKALTINTLAGKIVPFMQADGLIRVDMGKPELNGPKVPTTLPTNKDGRVIEAPMNVGGKDWKVTCVSMGNPHAVVFVDDLEGFDFPRVGPLFENHKVFPKRTNTEFVQVLSRSHLKMKVWERGAGPTQACGTGACALLVAAVLCGKSDRKATVTLPGGDLIIEWTEEGTVFMTGPAEYVFSSEIKP